MSDFWCGFGIICAIAIGVASVITIVWWTLGVNMDRRAMRDHRCTCSGYSSSYLVNNIHNRLDALEKVAKRKQK